jgi:protein arginine kinase activator
LIERTHEGRLQHIGKAAARVGESVKNRQRLFQLRQELQRAIDEEAYEDAARLRDEISKLESA